jgi:glycosyltransferase involved in cell wall biosynthesis
VLPRRPDAVLNLVGRGDVPGDEELLRAEADRLGVAASVRFLGQMPQAEALQHVARADVCVSPIFPTPILNVGSPTKLVEYLAQGRPVVANDHPDQRLVIELSGGGLCVPWDEAAFAEAILALLADPAAAERRGRQGREWVRVNRTYPVLAAAVEERYLRIARDRRAGQR